MIAVLIKTFFREKILKHSVKALTAHMESRNIAYRIYIADDGEISATQEKFYKDLEAKGHCVLRLPFNVGASAGRNALLNSLQNEKYILRMDDDFEVFDGTRIMDKIKILESSERIGAVAGLEIQCAHGKGSFSGEVSMWQGFLCRREKILEKRLWPLEKFEYFKIPETDIVYAHADFTRNFILLRREIFRHIRWDDRLKFSGEHLDFLLQIKSSPYDLVFTPNSKHLHRDDMCSDSSDRLKKYIDFKSANSNKDNVFQEKWGIKKIVIKRPIKLWIKSCFLKTYKIFRRISSP